jgi:hypothetical protein
MTEASDLVDMSDAPFVEKPVTAAEDSEASKVARSRLTAVLAKLNPAAGKTDSGDGKKKKKKGKA